jgi:hypothetical protein
MYLVRVLRLSHSAETENYCHGSLGALNQEWLCWQMPAAIYPKPKMSFLLLFILECVSVRGIETQRINQLFLFLDLRFLVHSKGLWQWCITLRITGFCGLCLSSGIPKTTEHNVSETGSVSVLNEGSETSTLFGPLEKTNLNHWTTRQYKKAKAIPVTGRWVPQFCEMSRFPQFLDSRFTDDSRSHMIEPSKCMRDSSYR